MSARIKELEEKVWFHNVNANYEPRMRTSSKLPLSNRRRVYKRVRFGQDVKELVISLYNIFPAVLLDLINTERS